MSRFCSLPFNVYDVPGQDVTVLQSKYHPWTSSQHNQLSWAGIDNPTNFQQYHSLLKCFAVLCISVLYDLLIFYCILKLNNKEKSQASAE